MERFAVAFLVLVLAAALQPLSLRGNEFTEQEAKIMHYKQWLDTVGPQGSRYWIRLDARHRPHRLYVGEAFYRADFKSQEHFLDVFSNYLAGQPDKFVLIYLFDANTSKRVGEYGFDGFKLYSIPMRTAQAPQKNSLVDVFQLKAKQIEPRLFGPQILWLSQVVASSYIV